MSGAGDRITRRCPRIFSEKLRGSVYDPAVGIRERVNDDSENHVEAIRYGRGSTALVVLHVASNVWTANLGDCEAVVGFQSWRGVTWEPTIILKARTTGAIRRRRPG